jgi:integrase
LIDAKPGLLKAAQKDENIQIYPFVLIALETSMRRSEIFSIRRDHINFEQLSISVLKAKAGSREQRITAHLAAFLHEYIRTLSPGRHGYFPHPRRKKDILLTSISHSAVLSRKQEWIQHYSPAHVTAYGYHPSGTGRNRPPNRKANFGT